MTPAETSQAPDPKRNHWPHRLAWVVACGIFPLIWMGGLVTTYGAGMAVPDWPTTYDSWFYPLQNGSGKPQLTSSWSMDIGR